METTRMIHAVDTHTAGEPTRIITGGVNRFDCAGGTVAEQRDRFAERYDHIREFVINEPRGHDDMFGAVQVDPSDDRADVGLFFMDNDGYLDMCGHGTMGAVTYLVESGQLECKSPIFIETPAGIVTARTERTDGDRPGPVTVQNTTSYVIDSRTVRAQIAGTSRELPVDIVSAGNVFALIPASAVDLPVEQSHVGSFVEIGLRIRAAIDDQLDLTDPIHGGPVDVDIVEFYEPREEVDRNIVVFSHGSVDRSPCGTGTCAKMTLLYENGELDVDEEYPYASVIGTQFVGRIRDVEKRDGITVTVPEVAGEAYITASHTLYLDPRDPLPSFTLYDNR